MIIIILINNSIPYTYKNNGGLAQLGERLNGIQKVRGSTPLSSTISTTYEGCDLLDVYQKVIFVIRLCKFIN